MSSVLRLVLHTILCECEEAVNLFGPCCSSWGMPARSTSQRNYVNAYGAMHLGFVMEANVTMARFPNSSERTVYIPCLRVALLLVEKLRLTLVCMLILAKHCYFILEQPGASLLFRHPRWERFCNKTCYVSWMATPRLNPACLNHVGLSKPQRVR